MDQTDNGKIGMLAKTFCDKALPLEVVRSWGCYYIGTTENSVPFSRESVESWGRRGQAEQALKDGTWTQLTVPAP